MSEITVRRGAAEDRAACAAIYARTWPSAFPGIERLIDQDVFDRETEEELIFVAVRDGAIIGFAAYYPPGNFLHHLFVDPSAQGGGAGSALLKTIQAQAGPGLSLKAKLSNHRARSFYAAQGWTEGETGADDYGAWTFFIAP
jgi:GNAT superfamily N-acetyltransferase